MPLLLILTRNRRDLNSLVLPNLFFPLVTLTTNVSKSISASCMHWLSLAHRCFFYYFWSNYLLYKFWEVEVFYKFLQPWIWVYLFSKFYGSRQYFCQEISIFLLCWISIDLLSFCEIIFLVHTWDGKWKRECIFSHFIILPQYFNNLYFAIVCVVGLYFFQYLKYCTFNMIFTFNTEIFIWKCAAFLDSFFLFLRKWQQHSPIPYTKLQSPCFLFETYSFHVN